MNTSTKKFTGAALMATGLFALASWIAPGYYRMTVENDFIRSLRKKTLAYTDKLAEDRVYLQFDKPFYNPGETIWFSAFVRDGQSMKPSGKSDIVHVELVSPKGTTEKTIHLIARNGIAQGDFTLEEEALGGIYKVKAYTNWQKNDPAKDGIYGFEKELQVQDIVLPNLKMKLDFVKKAYGPGDEVEAKLEVNTNENKPLASYKIKYVADINGKKEVEETALTSADGMKTVKFRLPGNLKSSDGLLNIMIDYNGNTESISRSIPIVLNNINLSFFPEGGDMVAGLPTNVAFRALNEFNKPADIEGVVKDADGKQVAQFSSFHMGMGSFSFKPLAGMKYTAEIIKPEGIKKQYELPEALPKGYVLETENSVNGEVGLNIGSTETEELSVVGQVRGKIYYATAFNVKPGQNKLLVPVSNFPAGVAQFTIFDSKGIARAERLTFVNKNKQLNIKIETDKEKYLPREKVKMTVSVTDENGVPMPGNFSLSVTNDQLLSFADDRSGNILSKMLLEYDIKDKVEEPAFYFDKKEPRSDKALDYLLMTSGWRRFSWEKVTKDELPSISYEGERALISGTVIDAYTGKPIANADIKLASSGTVFKTDEYGKFIFNKIDLYQPQVFTVSAANYPAQQQYVYSYAQNVVYYLYSNNYNYYNYPSSQVLMDELAPMGSAGGGMKEVEMEAPRKGHLFSAPNKSAPMDKNAPKNRKAPVVMPAPNLNVSNLSKLEEKDEGKKQDKDEKSNSDKKKIRVDDWRSKRLSASGKSGEGQISGNDQEMNNGSIYYRAKQFAAPVYDKQETVEQRNDFRSTIYWNGNIETDRSGKKTLEFYNSDDISSFRAVAEGFAEDEMIGHAEKNYFTQLPFAMTIKMPVEVATTDVVSVPLTLKNNTTASISGMLEVKAPSTFKALSSPEKVYTIAPGKAKTLFLEYKVMDAIGQGDFSVAFKSCGLSDAFSQKIKTVAKGFPVNLSFSGSNLKGEYDFNISNAVEGSVNVHFTAFPSVVNDLMTGIEGILREPSGCFEQTSMSSYPNIMAMDYLKTTDSKDEKTLAYAGSLIDKGYKRLVTFETPQKGYEWFGAAPGHQGLTAYGLMQFNDMKNVYSDVDQDMIDRTAKWLMSQKDGKGGWSRNTRAYHNFGMISEDIMNGYIVYALAEAGYRDFKLELDASVKKAIEIKDPYQLAMMANALQKFNDSRADNVMNFLLKTQKEDGSFTGTSHSITYSQGQSLTIETTAIAIMAMLKDKNHDAGALNKAVQYLVKSRSGYGVFGNTQGTVLALKALTEYAKQSKKTAEDGTIEIYSGGKKIAEKSYTAGQSGTIQVDSLGKYFGEGKNNIKIKFTGTKTALPYAIGVDYNTNLPPSSPECNVEIKTKLASTSAFVGETVRLSTTLKNNKNEGLPSTMAIIGIPAGMTAQPWQLKELQEKKVIDYYEVMGNNVVFYFRGMAPSEKKEINLDLKAEMPGEYDAPASSAYLYYTNEYKCWSGVDRITIKKPM